MNLLKECSNQSMLKITAVVGLGREEKARKKAKKGEKKLGHGI